MKKILALILVLTVLCAASCALAEGTAPLYATVGEALAAAGENPVAGGEEGYYAVVTEIDGKYYRSFAETDEKYEELQQAIYEAEPDQIEAAFAAADEYTKTLPIAYSEEFTAAPMEQAELDALAGKTIGDLREAGYEDRESGLDGDEIVWVMRSGMFDYTFAVDANLDTYEKAQEEPDGVNGFVVKSADFKGVTSEACFRRFHTDGTEEEVPDPFTGYLDLIADVREMAEKARNGEEVNAEEFFGGLREKYPDIADSVDLYVQLYNVLGMDGLLQMLTPVE